MTPQELKNSILQRAIEGKLVEQRPEEGTAEELYAQIQEEKKKLIAEKKIKKEKPLPEITEDEKPFDIPDSWKWIRLGYISTYNWSKPKVSANNIMNETWSLDLEDIKKDSGRIIKICKASERKISGDKIKFFKGQVLYSKLRPYLKKILVAPNDGVCSSEIVPFDLFGNIIPQYVVYFLRSPYVNIIVNSATYGIKMPRVSSKTMIELLVPLPPLAEQKRIVAKIEELQPMVERYEKAWNELEHFNKKFPEDMKKSLLQYAIQGKLVEQRPEEGTAEELYAQIQEEKKKLIAEKKIKKEKPLPEITEDEIPFEIPKSWKWVRVGECFSNKTGLSYKKSDLDINKDPMIRILRGGNILETSYTLKADDKWISSEFVKPDLFLKKNTIITPAVTSLEHIGKMGRIESNYNNMVVGGFVLMLIPYFSEDILSKYLLYAMSSSYFRTQCRNIVNKSGQAFYNLSRAKLMQLYIPLPPLAEQKRIVEKLDQLLPLCDKLA